MTKDTQEWEERFDALLHGWIASRSDEKQYKIIKAGETIIDPECIKEFIRTELTRQAQTIREETRHPLGTYQVAYAEGRAAGLEEGLATANN